ncbi:MAG: HAD-IC family P-type ATPase, partial [bacterium]|nr:HAD-IC family P-type ATPase [bacterium]
MIQRTKEEQQFWALPASKVVEVLETDARGGLSESEAERRIKVFGPNIIEKPRRAPGLFILLNQFKSPLILILLFAGVVTLFITHYRDALFIFAAVIANAALGFYQEYKAEKALAELKTYLKQRARVIRDGIEREIDAAELVPGDIIHLAQGDRIPADGRLLFVNDLQIDEAILTGESLPVSKSVDPVNEEAVIGDQYSMVFAGTLVIQGVGTAVICRTDFATELGKIATLVSESQREETPLQNAIKRFSIKAGIVLGIFTLIIFGIGIALGYSRVDMFLTSIAIAVSAVPEGLPVAMTVILAIGVQRMARRKGVIRKLIAAETLGDVSVILTDKTGTLTMAKMELSKVLPIEGGEPRRFSDAIGRSSGRGPDTLSSGEKNLLELALINTNVLIENPNDPPAEWRTSGRILETALVRSAALRDISVEDVKRRTLILNSLPFNAANKFSASLIHDGEKHLLLFFGAPDIFIGHSTLSSADQDVALKEISSLAESGELVVGVATKEIEKKEDFTFSKDLELADLVFQGLITMRDPVRPNVRDAIQKVQGADIRVIVMTGDHRGTAEAVAKEVGFEIEKESVLDSSELRLLSDADLKKRLPFLRVISRVSPLDKMRIVKAFQEIGEVVAMTGDGVN